jgi:hypothetical protein
MLRFRPALKRRGFLVVRRLTPAAEEGANGREGQASHLVATVTETLT